MKSSTQKIIEQKDRRSYGIQVTKFDSGIESDKFIVPVYDVRDGEQERKIINNQIKQSNRSKFTQPSFSVMGNSYQTSYKK